MSPNRHLDRSNGTMDTVIYGIGGGRMSDPLMSHHYARIVDLAKAQFNIDRPQIAILPTAHFNGTHSKLGRGYIDFTGPVDALHIFIFESLNKEITESRIIQTGRTKFKYWLGLNMALNNSKQ